MSPYVPGCLQQTLTKEPSSRGQTLSSRWFPCRRAGTPLTFSLALREGGHDTSPSRHRLRELHLPLEQDRCTINMYPLGRVSWGLGWNPEFRKGKEGIPEAWGFLSPSVVDEHVVTAGILLNTYNVPHSVPSTAHASPLLILITTHLDTEAQKGAVTCPGSCSWEGMGFDSSSQVWATLQSFFFLSIYH